jgi:glycosyltransferase involved in cell wall biosynthesis
MQPVLTIAIPTYNRSRYLELCLGQIFKQIQQHESLVEIIISDNCSTDDTAEVVQSYANKGLSFRYVHNEENIGADRNFVQCFTLAGGTYVLILGDDDVLLDGALDKIITVLTSGEYGLVYVNSYGFSADHLLESPRKQRTGTVVYTETKEMIERVNYWLTFASGNIVNKTVLDEDLNASEFVDTNLVQLNWVLSALFNARENAVIEDYLIAYKSANTGGYRLCQVFGENINRIFSRFIERGVDKRYFDVINSRLVQTFFPNLIVIQRRARGGFDFEAEDYFTALRQVFGGYPAFWLVTVPALKLPVKLASLWTRLCRIALRVVTS